jgi:basic amino acid/polyamine antiporter, APA family
MVTESSAQTPKRTLGLTGVTINAMALIAPGAFLWLVLPLQMSATNSSTSFALDIWPGVLLAFFVSLIASLSFAELVQRYPSVNYRNAYQLAERVFSGSSMNPQHALTRLAKFITGWACHLYYWTYPGVLIAFVVVVTEYVLRSMGYAPTIFGQIILAGAYAAFIGFLALRGITGTITSSIVLNIVQTVAILLFALLAILFRIFNPLEIQAIDWLHGNALSVILPHSLNGVLFQTVIAMILMVGFETSTVLGVVTVNPQRDIPRGSILALILQGVFIYLVSYFASGLALHKGILIDSAHAPIGDLALSFGDSFLVGNGPAFMYVMAFTTILALVFTVLSSMNTGVRVTFSMALDSDLPDIMGFVPEGHFTPYVAVVLLVIVSSIIGVIGIVGGITVLMGLVIAANIGALLLYGMVCLLTIVAYHQDTGFTLIRHAILPVVGLVACVALIAVPFVIGLPNEGIIRQAAITALIVAGCWLLFSIAYFAVLKFRTPRPV